VRCKNLLNFGSVTPEITTLESAIFADTFIWHTIALKRFSGSQFRFTGFFYVVYKFGEIQSSNPVAYDVRMCTAASVITGVSLTTFARG